jgi:hypothetical protein
MSQSFLYLFVCLHVYLTLSNEKLIREIPRWKEFQDSKREEAESMLPKEQSWRDSGDTPYRKK